MQTAGFSFWVCASLMGQNLAHSSKPEFLTFGSLKSQDTSKNSAGSAHVLQFFSLKKESVKNQCFASMLLCVCGIFFDV